MPEFTNMVALINLTGSRFGRLVVTDRAPNKPGKHTRWSCQCDCGGQTVVDASCLRGGVTRSCGCLTIESIVARSVTHEDTRHGGRAPEYTAWLNMRNRCSGKHPQSLKAYFERGIRVCGEWDRSYEAFLAYVGRRPGPGYSIDRIDNDGNYEPGNVRWATDAQQRANKRYNGRKAAA